MSSQNNLPPGSNIAAALVTGVSAVIASLWVAICAAAPEFIWQGLQIAFSEPIWTWLPSALLVGMILAFFVEPMMQYLRGYLVDRARYRRVRKRTPNALFAASLAFAFAIVSICLHDALIAFVSTGHGGHSDKSAGLLAAFALVVAWAIGPFAVTIAWLGARCRWLAIPLGIAAVAAPLVAEWLFAWPVVSVISTAVPSLAILGLGYRQNIPENPARGARTCFSCRSRLARDSPSHPSGGKGLTLPAVSTLRCRKLLDGCAFLYRLGSRAFACTGGRFRSTQRELIGPRVRAPT